MTDQNDPISLGVARAPADVVAPIADPDSPWEGEVTRPRDQLGGATDRDQDGQFSRRVTARIQGGEAIWSVVEFGPTFTEPPDPWLGASIVFEITKSDGDTQVRSAYHGLAPEIQSDESCADTRTTFVGTACTRSSQHQRRCHEPERNHHEGQGCSRHGGQSRPRSSDEELTGNDAIQVTGVATVGIPVRDQERALEFYVGTLCLEKSLDVPIPSGGRWIALSPRGESGTTLALVMAKDDVPSGVETGVRLTTPDADAAQSHLAGLGVDVGDVLRWPGVPPMFTLRDPDGNRLELIEAP